MRCLQGRQAGMFLSQAFTMMTGMIIVSYRLSCMLPHIQSVRQAHVNLHRCYSLLYWQSWHWQSLDGHTCSDVISSALCTWSSQFVSRADDITANTHNT